MENVSTKLIGLLDCSPRDEVLTSLLDELSSSSSSGARSHCEVKSYPDVVYHNYRHLGLSLQFEPRNLGAKATDCKDVGLSLVAVDVYSGQHSGNSNEKDGWSCFPSLPLHLNILERGQPKLITIEKTSDGKYLIFQLGEPARKGGGEGGRMGPAAWMEWNLTFVGADKPVKMQIELAGPGARGPERWNLEKGGTATWAVITLSH